MTGNRIRILIVDDHPIVLKGLTATIEQEPDMEVAGAASTGPRAVSLYRELLPDVTIMDISLTPGMTGTEATRAIRADFPEARIIMLTVHKGDEDIYQALHAGAATYLLKESLGDNLASTIREVHRGGRKIPQDLACKLADRVFQTHLTGREIEVLRLVADGLRNKEIAAALRISENTTQGHVKSILAKLHVNDRSGAVTTAIRRGIIRIPE
ncbi:MAG TPA: response regulator transcription factor [Bryobacteraceae bacterium]|nr:response regulator transcription factor [Bryobacteraceae bacterium]